MLDSKFFDELAQKITHLIPPGVQNVREEVEKNVRSTVLHFFSTLDLVTREEFDVQVALLQKASKKIAKLEKRIIALEHGDEETKNDK